MSAVPLSFSFSSSLMLSSDNCTTSPNGMREWLPSDYIKSIPKLPVGRWRHIFPRNPLRSIDQVSRVSRWANNESWKSYGYHRIAFSTLFVFLPPEFLIYSSRLFSRLSRCVVESLPHNVGKREIRLQDSTLLGRNETKSPRPMKSYR